MRNKMNVLLFINLFLVSNIALSQRLITGWKVGPNLSTLSITEDNNIFGKQLTGKNVSQIGFDLGVFKTLLLNEKWDVNVEASYQLRRVKILGRKQYFSYLNISPIARYYVSDDVVVFSGINTGILLNALEVYDAFLNDPGGSLGLITVKRNRNKYYSTIDLQWLSGLEVKVSKFFRIEFRGALSLFDINSQYNNTSGVNFTTLKFWSLSLSTKFYLKDR